MNREGPFRDVFQLGASAEYEPARNWINLPAELVEHLGRAARIFLLEAYGTLDLTRPLLVTDGWRDRILDQFQALGHGDRLDVLCFETMLLHELVHRVDYTHTVHGAMYRHLTIDQGIRLLDLFPYLVRSGADVSGPPHQWQLPALSTHSDYTEDLRRLRYTHRELAEYFHFLPKGRLSSGWPPGDRSITVFGAPGGPSYSVATLRFSDGTTIPTVEFETPGGLALYLRPSAVVEARAIAHAMRHLVKRFSDRPPLAFEELERYWSMVRQHAYDYQFVMDFTFQNWGFVSLEHFFDATRESSPTEHRLKVFEMLLTHCSALAWVSMAGMDISQRILAVLFGYTNIAEGNELVSPWELSDGLEVYLSEFAARRSHWFPDVESTMSAAISLISSHDTSRLPTGFNKHSDLLVGEIVKNLSERVGRGYVSRAGFPNDGNPCDAYRDDATMLDAVLDSGNSRWKQLGVDDWFRLRRVLVAPSPQDAKVSAWRNTIGE